MNIDRYSFFQAVYYVPNVPNVPTGSVDVLLSIDFKKMVPKVPIF